MCIYILNFILSNSVPNHVNINVSFEIARPKPPTFIEHRLKHNPLGIPNRVPLMHWSPRKVSHHTCTHLKTLRGLVAGGNHHSSVPLSWQEDISQYSIPTNIKGGDCCERQKICKNAWHSFVQILLIQIWTGCTLSTYLYLSPNYMLLFTQLCAQNCHKSRKAGFYSAIIGHLVPCNSHAKSYQIHIIFLV